MPDVAPQILKINPGNTLVIVQAMSQSQRQSETPRLKVADQVPVKPVSDVFKATDRFTQIDFDFGCLGVSQVIFDEAHDTRHRPETGDQDLLLLQLL